MLVARQHHRPILDKFAFRKAVGRLEAAIVSFRDTHPVDAIAFCGMSGAVISGVIANNLGLDLLMVRKKGEENVCAAGHQLSVSGNYSSKNYVIVDDLICSGGTVQHIINSIEKNVGSKCQGIFVYCKNYYEDNFPQYDSEFVYKESYPVIGVAQPEEESK